MSEEEKTVKSEYAASAPEAWAKIARETGIRMRTEHDVEPLDWSGFALNCEAAIGMLVAERHRLATLVQRLGGNPNEGVTVRSTPVPHPGISDDR